VPAVLVTVSGCGGDATAARGTKQGDPADGAAHDAATSRGAPDVGTGDAAALDAGVTDAASADACADAGPVCTCRPGSANVTGAGPGGPYAGRAAWIDHVGGACDLWSVGIAEEAPSSSTVPPRTLRLPVLLVGSSYVGSRLVSVVFDGADEMATLMVDSFDFGEASGSVTIDSPRVQLSGAFHAYRCAVLDRDCI